MNQRVVVKWVLWIKGPLDDVPVPYYYNDEKFAHDDFNSFIGRDDHKVTAQKQTTVKRIISEDMDW